MIRYPSSRQAGFILTTEAILLFTIVILAVLVALAAVRNALVDSGVVVGPVFVYDSSDPALVVGKLVDLDAAETPRVLRRDPANGLSVPLGVRERRLTSRTPVFFDGAACTGGPYVYGQGFETSDRTSSYHQLHAAVFAVGPPGVAAPAGLLLRDDGTAPCAGVGCPPVVSVWISEWTFDDAPVGDPAPLDPCRALTVPGPMDGLVPAVEVLDGAATANLLAPFNPPFQLR